MSTWLAKAEARSYADDLRRHFARAIREAAAEEREAAARIVELGITERLSDGGLLSNNNRVDQTQPMPTRAQLAAAIRERGGN